MKKKTSKMKSANPDKGYTSKQNMGCFLKNKMKHSKVELNRSCLFLESERKINPENIIFIETPEL